jgi:hypothetical protein
VGRTHVSRAFFISKGTKCRTSTLYTTVVAILIAITGVGWPPPPPSCTPPPSCSAGTSREITSTKVSTFALITISCEQVNTRAVRFMLKKAHFLKSCDMQASPLTTVKAVRSASRTPFLSVSSGSCSTTQRIFRSGSPPFSTFSKTKGTAASRGYWGSGADGSSRSWAPATRTTMPSRPAIWKKSIGGRVAGGGGGGAGAAFIKVLSASYSPSNRA